MSLSLPLIQSHPYIKIRKEKTLSIEERVRRMKVLLYWFVMCYSVPSVGIVSGGNVVAQKSTTGAISAHVCASNCSAFSKPNKPATIFAGKLRI